MTKHFDWRENQTVPGVISNPGTGPVHETSREQARKNMDTFLSDVLGDRTDPVVIEDNGGEDEGRYTFTLRRGERTSEIDMPGIPLDQVRFLGRPDQNIFDFPRLYENGSSWVWCYAVSQAEDSLFGEALPDRPLGVPPKRGEMT